MKTLFFLFFSIFMIVAVVLCISVSIPLIVSCIEEIKALRIDREIKERLNKKNDSK